MSRFTFGLYTDIQYADRPMRIGRFYRNALKKTEACISAFNENDVDFIVHLGDMIDWSNQPEQGRKALADVLRVIDRYPGPKHFLLGNHDVDSVPPEELAQTLPFPGGRTWYSFDHKGVHFIMLDCNFDEQETPYRPGTTRWDDCWLPSFELEWLKNDLAAAQSDVAVVMVHALLDDLSDRHVIRNAQAARTILEGCGKQVIVFQGHMHCGRESETNGIGYHTLPAIVNGRTHNVYWLVDVDDDAVTATIYDTLRRSGPQRRVLLKRK